jgi:hypothetical protein
MDTDAHGFFTGIKNGEHVSTASNHRPARREIFFQFAATLSQFACGGKVDFLFTAP